MNRTRVYRLCKKFITNAQWEKRREGGSMVKQPESQSMGWPDTLQYSQWNIVQQLRMVQVQTQNALRKADQIEHSSLFYTYLHYNVNVLH